jgi:hypothetical protein
MNTKICYKCKQEKPVSDYHKCKPSKDGLQRKCKSCNIAYTLAFHKRTGRTKQNNLRANEYRQLFTAIVETIKSEIGCQFCDEKDGCCLDCHHISDKEVEISELCAKKSKTKIIEELAKCIIVCSNCHRKIHAGKLEATNKPKCIVTLEKWAKIREEVEPNYIQYKVGVRKSKFD